MICLVACCISISTFKNKVQVCAVGFFLQHKKTLSYFPATSCWLLGALVAGRAAGSATNSQEHGYELLFPPSPLQTEGKGGWSRRSSVDMVQSSCVRYSQSHPFPLSPAGGMETVWCFYCTCSSASVTSKMLVMWPDRKISGLLLIISNTSVFKD